MPQYAPYGNAIYGITAYGSPPAVSVQTTMSVSPIPTSGSPSIGLYDSLFVSWVLPGGNWNQMVLVRSSFAVPSSPFGNDGVQLLNQTGTSFSTSFTDTGLQTGRFYYYALYVYDTDVNEWLQAASAQGLCLTDYGFQNLFTAWTPDWYMEQDLLLVPYAPLARFFGLIGFEMNWVRSEIETLFTLNSPEYISGAMLPYLGSNVGIGYEPALGMGLSRNLVSQAVQLYKMKGTAPGVQAAASAYTGYGCILTLGPNLELQLDTAAFDRAGQWWRVSNANSIINIPSGVGGATIPPRPHSGYNPIQGNTGLSTGLLTTAGASGYLPVNNQHNAVVSVFNGSQQWAVSTCTTANAQTIGIPVQQSPTYMIGVINPIDWWRLNESVPGTVYDYGSNGSAGWGALYGSGTLVGQPGVVPADTAYTFNGNSYILVTPTPADMAMSSSTSFCFGAFVKTSTTANMGILAYGSYTTNTGGQYFLYNFNGRLQALVTDSNTSHLVQLNTPAANWSDGKWHFLVCVFDRVNSLFTLYIDGVANVSTAIPSGFGSVSVPPLGGALPALTIGADAYPLGASKFSGSIQEVFIAPMAPTAAQVSSLYQSLLSQTTQPVLETYVLSGYFKNTGSPLRQFYAQLDWYSSNGSLISSTAGTPVTEINNTWVRCYAVGTPPANAAYIGRSFLSSGTLAQSDSAHGWDAVQLEINTQATPGPSAWTPPRDLWLNLFPYARNLVVNGQGILGTQGFDNGGTGSTITAVTTGPVPTSGSTWPANVSQGFSVTTSALAWTIETAFSSPSYLPVNTGQAYSAAVWVWSSLYSGYNTNNTFQVNIKWYASTNSTSYLSTTVGPTVSGVTIGQARGNWIQCANLDAIAPVGAMYAQIVVTGTSNANGTVYVAAPTFGPGLNITYFDGLFSPSPDYAFEGTPNLSPSAWYPNVLTRLDRLIEVMPEYIPIGATFSIYTHALAWSNVGLH